MAMTSTLHSDEAIFSNALKQPTSQAILMRIPPSLRQRLLQAEKSGEKCTLRTAGHDGSGACLIIGDQMVSMISNSVSNTEVLKRQDFGGSCEVSAVSHKMKPQPNGMAASKEPTLAQKARQLNSQVNRLTLQAAIIGSVPVSGRTTAPQRPSLMVRKRASPSSDVPPPRPSSALPMASAPTAGTSAPSGAPVSPEQIQAALASGGLRMVMAALLTISPLKGGALVKKVGEAFQAAKQAPPGKPEILREVKHVAEYRSPGMYVLLPDARKDLEALQHSGISNHPQKEVAGGSKSSASKLGRSTQSAIVVPSRAVDRDWTSELSAPKAKQTKGRTGLTPPTPTGREVSENSKALSKKQPAGVNEVGDAKVPTREGATWQAAKRLRVQTETPEPGKIPSRGQAGLSSLESNGTMFSGGGSPDVAPEHRSSPPMPAKAATNAIGDISWFKEHIGRDPVLVGTISSAEEFEVKSLEYKTKYAVYHRLHQEIQEAKRFAGCVAEAHSRREAEDMAKMWGARKQRLPLMEQAYWCLHQELASLKGTAREFASSYHNS